MTLDEMLRTIEQLESACAKDDLTVSYAVHVIVPHLLKIVKQLVENAQRAPLHNYIM